MNSRQELDTKVSIAIARARGKEVKKAMEAFAAYATNPGMEDEIMEMVKQTEDIEKAMVEELTRRGMKVERQLQVPIDYKGKRLASPLRLDLKVNGLVLIDNKAVTEWNPIFEAQMLTYLRLTKLKLGLVINFGEQYVKNGIRRVANGL